MNNIKIRVKLYTNIPANDADHEKRPSKLYIFMWVYVFFKHLFETLMPCSSGATESRDRAHCASEQVTIFFPFPNEYNCIKNHNIPNAHFSKM